MRAKLKPLAEQVVVVAGASAGLGLAVARKAAQGGAAVVLTGHDEPALRRAAEEINAAGGRAHPVVGDLADPEAAARVARAAIARFGGFDTWIAEAGGHELGLVTGAREAARHLRGKPGGGAVIGLAAGQARAAQALRRELAGAPISFTRITLPRGLDLAGAPPAAVAAVLHAAAHPVPRMAVASGRRLTVATEAQKHRGLVLGVGLAALAVAAVWYGRGRIAGAARPLLVRAAMRRPLTAARLVARRPKQALKLARALR